MNMQRTLSRLLRAVPLALLAGCTVGYDETLFYTRSNFGLNATTTPPVAEISLSRREGVIGPTFEGGQHLPVYASFHVDTTGFLPVSVNIASLFAGGTAAALVSDPSKVTYDEDNPQDQKIARVCVSQIPNNLPPFDHFPQAGEVRPFTFATDTTTGLKVSWTGTTSAIPDTVVFGYNRKELALAPTFASSSGSCPSGQTMIRMPAFLAKVDNGVSAKMLGDSTFNVNQFFATGSAANNLALLTAIKDSYLTEAASQIIAYSPPDAATKTIQCWADSDPTKAKKVTDWLHSQKNLDVSYDVFLADSKYAQQRADAVSDRNLGITCP